MKISGSNVEVSYGDDPTPLDWRAHQSAHPETKADQEDYAEDGTPEERARAWAILGFDPMGKKV